MTTRDRLTGVFLRVTARRREQRELSGRVVLITGGAQGIGLATAQACAAAGMPVAIADLRLTAAEQAANDIAAASGVRTLALELDVRDAEAFQRGLVEVERELGPLYALVNNAGVLHPGPFAQASASDVARQIDVNLSGMLTGTRLALDAMLPRGRGHIVNLASQSSLVASPGGAVYAASKAGVLAFTRALRMELRGSGVRATAVLPGIIRTEMTSHFRGALGVRTVDADAVGAAIVGALRAGTSEVYVPREVAAQGRIFQALPAGAHDRLQRLTGADHVVN